MVCPPLCFKLWNYGLYNTLTVFLHSRGLSYKQPLLAFSKPLLALHSLYWLSHGIYTVTFMTSTTLSLSLYDILIWPLLSLSQLLFALSRATLTLSRPLVHSQILSRSLQSISRLLQHSHCLHKLSHSLYKHFHDLSTPLSASKSTLTASKNTLHNNLGLLLNVFQGMYFMYCTYNLFNILSDEAGYCCKLGCAHPHLPACQRKRLYRQAHFHFFLFSWQTGLPHMTFVLARS